MRRLVTALLLSGSLCCFAQTDGPAILPLTVPATVAVSQNTPRSIGAGENLQDAINAAACGDTLSVDPAMVWNGSLNVVTSAVCDTAHWLTVQSATAPQLDAKGRVIPGQQLPKIVLTTQNGHVTVGSVVRLAGFEITRTQGTGIVYNLMLPQTGAHDIILDMIYAHGTPQDETNRGISLSDSSRVAILNSYFSDLHCRSISGACGDSQAIAGGTDMVSSGEYLVRNNYLEAAGQSFMLGGGGSADVPADVTIQGNSLRKQLSWNPADPSYGGGTAGKDGTSHPWIVKNCLELKNAQRVLIENNTCENVWGGFTQLGFAFLLTAKNQASATGTSVCPLCSVHDVTIRYNRVSHACAAAQIGLGPNDLGAYATSQYGISIHDNVFDDLNDPDLYQCGHWLLQLSSGATPAGQVLHDVTFSHNTLNVAKWHGPNGPTDGKYHGALTFGAPVTTPMYNIHFDSNIFPAGSIPIITTGGGAANCAYTAQSNPLTIIPNCWAGTSSFSSNVILTNGYTGTLKWPDTTVLSPVGANLNLLP